MGGSGEQEEGRGNTWKLMGNKNKIGVTRWM